MELTIELDWETDGRWIAEVPEWNVLLYGIQAGRDQDSSIGRAGDYSRPDRRASWLRIRRVRLSTLPRVRWSNQGSRRGRRLQTGAALQPAGRLCI